LQNNFAEHKFAKKNLFFPRRKRTVHTPDGQAVRGEHD